MKIKRNKFIKLGAVFADKAVISAAHFVVGIILMRSLSKSDYGIYVNIFSFLMLGISVQNAIINAQMGIMAPKRSSALEERFFCHQLFIGQWGYWIPLAGIGIIVSIIVNKFGIVSNVATTIFIVAVFLQLAKFLTQFNRSYWFLRGMPELTLFQDTVYAATLILGAYFSVSSPAQHSALLLAFATMLLADILAGAATATYLIIKPKKGEGADGDNNKFILLVTLLRNGKWALMGAIVYWLQSTSYAWQLSLLGNTEMTADVNAARQMIMPISMLITAYPEFMRPRWSRHYHTKNVAKIDIESSLLIATLSTIIIISFLTLYFASNTLIPQIFGEKYLTSAKYLPLIGYSTICLVWSSNTSLKLQVIERFRQISILNTYTCIISVSLAFLLIPPMGAFGVLYSAAVSSTMYALLLWFELKKSDWKSIQQGTKNENIGMASV